MGAAPGVTGTPSGTMLSVVAVLLYGPSIHISVPSGFDLHSIWNLSEILLVDLSAGDLPEKKTQILKASSLQICKSCLHDHTVLLYSKYLCSPATVASMYVSYRTVVKYGEWYNNMVFKVICDAQGSTFIFLSPT